MTTIQFRSPVNQPLHRAGQCVPASDDFCVTQRFDDPDFYWSHVPNPPNPLPTHRATDIGNFRCGYPIVAMADGVAHRIKDNATDLGAPNDALGVSIDHGGGITTEYWHLASWTIPFGNVPVKAGQELGKLGNTGLGQVCHTHIEAKRNGVRFDPEPLMFGGTVTIGEEEDMGLPLGQPFALGRINAGVNLRPDHTTATDEKYTLTGADNFDVLLTEPKGGPYLVDGKTRTDWVLVRRSGDEDSEPKWAAKAFVAIAPTAAGIALVPPTTGGFTQADVDRARSVGFVDAKTKARVAVEAIAP